MAKATRESSESLVERTRTRLRRDHELRNRIRIAVSTVALGIVLLWLLLPIFWVIETSLKTRPVAQAFPPVFWGFELQWSNFVTVWTETPLPSYIWNGLIVATAVTVISLILGITHAYAISMYESRVGDMSFLFIVAARIVPPLSILVPFYVFFNRFGLIDTKPAVIIVQTAFIEPFVVWIMKGYFDNMSRSLIDSARTDGCTKFQAFYKIMLPIAKPGIASAAIISWLLTWNAFTAIFILTTSPQAMTLPVGVLSYSRDVYIPWNLISAASVIGIIPSAVIVIFFQNYLVEGMVESET